VSTDSGRQRRRPPAALVALMAVAFILSLAWTVVSPAFQAPDEQAHFAYAQSLGERFALPGEAGRPPFSTEHRNAVKAVNADQVAGSPLTKPEWSEVIEARWLHDDAADRADDGGGPQSASSYPPLSYLWESLGYRLFSSGDFFDTLFGSRLFSALWLPITVLGTWLLAGELLGRRRLLQLAAAAVPALLPMPAFVSGSVSPDGMLYALWSLALWLGVRALRRGVPLGTTAAFGAVVGLACVTKSVSLALLPAAGVVLVVGLWRRRSQPLGRLVAPAAAGLAALALTFGSWVLLARGLNRTAAANVSAGVGAAQGTNVRELISYVWQYYLPRLPGMDRSVAADIGYPAFRVWIVLGWAAFGWLEVRFAVGVYRVLALLTAVVGVAALVAIWRNRRKVDLAVLAFLAVATLALLAGLHWSDYHVLKAGGRFMQGRYIFPVVGLMGAALALAVTLVPARLRAGAVGAIVGGLFVFHMLALGLALERFYA
jgi:4-amino-4-deoxy-L-arabinose transferase-like glycosyltransferase